MWSSLVRDWAIIALILLEGIVRLEAVTGNWTQSLIITPSVLLKEKPTSEYVDSSVSSSTITLKLVSPIIETKPLPSYTSYSVMAGVHGEETSKTETETVKASYSSDGYVRAASSKRFKSMSIVMNSELEPKASTIVVNGKSTLEAFKFPSEALPPNEMSSSKATSIMQNKNAFEPAEASLANSDVKGSHILPDVTLIKSSAFSKVAAASVKDPEIGLSRVVEAKQTSHFLLYHTAASSETKDDEKSDVTPKQTAPENHYSYVERLGEGDYLTPSLSISTQGNDAVVMGHLPKMTTVAKSSPSMLQQFEVKTTHSIIKKGTIFATFSSNTRNLVGRKNVAYTVENTLQLERQGVTSSLESSIVTKQSAFAYHLFSTKTSDEVDSVPPPKLGQISKTIAVIKPSSPAMVQQLESKTTSTSSTNSINFRTYSSTTQEIASGANKNSIIHHAKEVERQELRNSLKSDVMIRQSTFAQQLFYTKISSYPFTSIKNTLSYHVIQSPSGSISKMEHSLKATTVVKPSPSITVQQLDTKATSLNSVSTPELLDIIIRTIPADQNTSQIESQGMRSSRKSDILTKSSASSFLSQSTKALDKTYSDPQSSSVSNPEIAQFSKTVTVMEPISSTKLRQLESKVTSPGSSSQAYVPPIKTSDNSYNFTQSTSVSIPEHFLPTAPPLPLLPEPSPSMSLQQSEFNVPSASSKKETIFSTYSISIHVVSKIKPSDKIYAVTQSTSVSIPKMEQISITTTIIKPSPSIEPQQLQSTATSSSGKKGTNFTTYSSSMQKVANVTSEVFIVQNTAPVEGQEISSSLKSHIMVEQSDLKSYFSPLNTSYNIYTVTQSTSDSIPKMEQISITTTIIKPSPSIKPQQLTSMTTSSSGKKGTNFTTYSSSMQKVANVTSEVFIVQNTAPVDGMKVEQTSMTTTIIKPSPSIKLQQLTSTAISVRSKKGTNFTTHSSSMQDAVNGTSEVFAVQSTTQVKSQGKSGSQKPDIMVKQSDLKSYLSPAKTSTNIYNITQSISIPNLETASPPPTIITLSPSMSLQPSDFKVTSASGEKETTFTTYSIRMHAVSTLKTSVKIYNVKQPITLLLSKSTKRIKESTMVPFVESTAMYGMTSVTSSPPSTKSLSSFLSTHTLSSWDSTTQFERKTAIPATRKIQYSASLRATHLVSTTMHQAEIPYSTKDTKELLVTQYPKSSINFQTTRAISPSSATASKSVFVGIAEQKFVVIFKLPSGEFTDELLNSVSEQFKEKKAEIEEQLNRVYENVPEYLRCEVQGFFKGSLGCIVAIFVESNESSPVSKEKIESVMRDANEKGTFGGVVNDANVLGLTSKENEDKKIWSLGPILVVSILAVVCTVLLVIVITQYIKRRHYTHSLAESSELAKHSPTIKMKRTDEECRDEERIPMTSVDRTTDIY